MCLLAPAVNAQYSGGTGEPNDPYQIATAADLIALGEDPNDYDKHFVLTADIDLDPNLPGGKVFDKAVIAPDTDPCDVIRVSRGAPPSPVFTGPFFAGVLDGQGHTISHLTIEGGDYLGLFGQLGYGAQVTDLGVVDADITGSGTEIGALAGANVGGSVIRCYSSGVVRGASSVGGLVGLESNPYWGWGWRTIMDCYSSAAVFASAANAGGLVGRSDGGTILRCYSTGPVAAASGAGGLVGGEWYSGSVADCFWDIETSGQASSAGGAGLTTEQMQTLATFAEWGICEGAGVWTIDEGKDYPRLSWEWKAGRPIETYLGEFLTGDGTPENPYLIYTIEDVNTIGKFPCEHDKEFRLMFLPGTGAEDDPYVIRDANDLDLLVQCPYERDKDFRLGFLPGMGTEDDPYVIRDAEDLDLLIRCPHEQDKQFRLGFLAGKGTPENPYELHAAHEVDFVGRCPYERGAHFVLMADIDLSGFDGKAGRPAMHTIASFAGVFDGNGHTISHLTIKSGSNAGFFGQLKPSAEVRDLWIVDVNIVTSSSYAGALAGKNEGHVMRCHSTGGVRGSWSVGGLIGENLGTVTECCSRTTAAGNRYVGGLLGSNRATLACCYSTGAVGGNEYVGGLVGENRGTVTFCYSCGVVRGSLFVGGLVGGDYSGTGTVAGGFWDIEASGRTTSAGGAGATRAEMQTAGTFLDAGWDFVHETTNGTEDTWYMLEGVHYPILMWELGYGPLLRPAFAPVPRDSGRDLILPLALGWAPGWPTLLHDVYFGDDLEAVAHATLDTVGVYRGRLPAESTTYAPDALEWATTYYWRIDEVRDEIPGDGCIGRVWAFTTAGYIGNPDPEDGVIKSIRSQIVLHWECRQAGMSYDVYFGEDREAVTNATVDTPGVYYGRRPPEVTTYDPGVLESDRIYYWRIDAIDETDPRSPWEGDVWSFGTHDADYDIVSVVDDFESYTDNMEGGEAIWQTWIDGWEGGSGSIVGYAWAPFAEMTIVHGGLQSMPVEFDNSWPPFYSEIERWWEGPQDWTVDEPDALTLYFRGDPFNSPGSLYVQIKDTGGRIVTVIHPNADAVQGAIWIAWRIALADVQAAGVDTTAVRRMVIGIGDRENPKPGGAGRIYIDDIRLTKRTP
jgi:hypothetical protein